MCARACFMEVRGIMIQYAETKRPCFLVCFKNHFFPTALSQAWWLEPSPAEPSSCPERKFSARTAFCLLLLLQLMKLLLHKTCSGFRFSPICDPNLNLSLKNKTSSAAWPQTVWPQTVFRWYTVYKQPNLRHTGELSNKEKRSSVRVHIYDLLAVLYVFAH